MRDRVGAMRHLVEVQQGNETSRLASGEKVIAWTTLFTAWCSIEPLTSREFFSATQVQTSITHKIKLRCRHDQILTGDMRMRLLPERTRAFHLLGPARNEDERGDYWECFVVEVVTNPES